MAKTEIHIDGAHSRFHYKTREEIEKFITSLIARRFLKLVQNPNAFASNKSNNHEGCLDILPGTARML